MNFTADTWWILNTVFTAAIGIITYFLKRTMSKQDKHEEEINHIKLTYVTKDDLKDVKLEFATTTQKLQKDIEEIKDTCLTKKDFIREHMYVVDKVDKMYEMLVKMTEHGEHSNN